jgi:hypothetical protein
VIKYCFGDQSFITIAGSILNDAASAYFTSSV